MTDLTMLISSNPVPQNEKPLRLKDEVFQHLSRGNYVPLFGPGLLASTSNFHRPTSEDIKFGSNGLYLS